MAREIHHDQFSAFLTRLEQARASATPAFATEPDATAVARGNRTVSEWLAALKSLAYAEGGMRSAPLTRDRLFALASDTRLDTAARAGAAAAIAAQANDGERTRLRVSAAAIAEPTLRAVFEAAATGEEESVRDALEAVSARKAPLIACSAAASDGVELAPTPRMPTTTTRRTRPATTGTRKWSHHVMETSDALDLEEGVFSKRSPRAIAASLKRSAERSTRRKSSPFRSAMSMLVFFENRGGKNLSAELERAKDELRVLFDRPAKTTAAVKRAKTRRSTSTKSTRGTAPKRTRAKRAAPKKRKPEK